MQVTKTERELTWRARVTYWMWKKAEVTKPCKTIWGRTKPISLLSLALISRWLRSSVLRHVFLAPGREKKKSVGSTSSPDWFWGQEQKQGQNIDMAAGCQLLSFRSSCQRRGDPCKPLPERSTAPKKRLFVTTVHGELFLNSMGWG